MELKVSRQLRERGECIIVQLSITNVVGRLPNDNASPRLGCDQAWQGVGSSGNLSWDTLWRRPGNNTVECEDETTRNGSSQYMYPVETSG